MNKIEIIELFNKNNIDTVGIAPIGPYEELKKVLEDKVNKNLITKIAFEKFGNLAGIAQQYLFYWKREA